MITKTELLKNVEAGQPLLVVEYRTAKADTLRIKAPKTGEQSIRPVVKHIVLVGDTSFEVMEWLPDGTDVSKVKPFLARATRCAIEVHSMEMTDYGNRMSGKLVAVDWSK